MGITQLNFEGKTKIEVSLDVIRAYEPQDGYFLAFAGGKDSVVLYDIALKSGVKLDAHYNLTGIDPPELVKFIKEYYPSIAIEPPKMTMWRGIEKKGLPTRRRRWCCEYLKYHSGKGRVRLTGIRADESSARRKLCFVTKLKGDTLVHPLFLWSTAEVWEYIRENKLPYCCLYDEGFKRLGCLVCPLARRIQRQMEIQRYPKYVEAYKRANRRHALKMGKTQQSADEYFEWWLNL